MTPWFIATGSFSPAARPADWRDYVAASGLDQLEEVVTLDSLLCPPILREIKAEYWPHIVNEDFTLQYFTDLTFLLDEVRGISPRNLLCIYRNPPRMPVPPGGIAWEFVGFDLVDVQGGNSALTNCGGFPLAFANDELSRCGLLTDLERAYEVRRELLQHYPGEPHADCHVWAIFRADEA